MDHARSGSGGGLPPQLDPGFLEQMSRAQSSGQFFPGDLRLQPQPNNLREHEYAVGGSQLNMPPLGPAYLPQPANLAHAYAPMDHARTEQQLAELFSSQLDLFGPPLGHPLYRHAPVRGAIPWGRLFRSPRRRREAQVQDAGEEPQSERSSRSFRHCCTHITGCSPRTAMFGASTRAWHGPLFSRAIVLPSRSASTQPWQLKSCKGVCGPFRIAAWTTVGFTPFIATA